MAWPFGRSQPLGSRGETLARRFLRKRGLNILARNYRCPVGEIDLIALDRSAPARGSAEPQGPAETIVFVEVKTRTGAGLAGPEAAVDARKRDQVRKAAQYYLSHYPTEGYAVRYDVVAVVLRDGQKPEIRHLPAAF